MVATKCSIALGHAVPDRRPQHSTVVCWFVGLSGNRGDGAGAFVAGLAENRGDCRVAPGGDCLPSRSAWPCSALCWSADSLKIRLSASSALFQRSVLLLVLVIGGGWDDPGQVVFRAFFWLGCAHRQPIWSSVVDPERPDAAVSGPGAPPLVTTESATRSRSLNTSQRLER